MSQAARRGEHLRASSSWAHVVQALAFVRKELAEVLRQPRLLVLLVAGPFIVLLLFGAGYRDTDLALRTQFVGPRGSVYEQAVEEYAEVLDDAAAVSASVDAGDEQALTEQVAAAVPALTSARTVVAGTQVALLRLGAEEEAAALVGPVGRLNAALADADAIAAGEAQGAELEERATSLATSMRTLGEELPVLTTIDPDVLVRPFESRTQNLLPVRVDPTDFFAPSSIILLLQHLAVTFAALSLVRDRELGLFELLRVGPLSSGEILIGKTTAYLLIGCAVGAVLVGAAVAGLGVPFEGDVGWAAVTVVMVLLASLALGTVLSLVSKSETQAVQFAMLSLLVGMFFSGFILDVDGLAMPYRLISYVQPVTYGISVLQDVMLRGRVPRTEDVAGLGALVVVYGAVAVVMLRRRLRTA